ncbi:MAG: hypothetical protein AAF805_09180, partial [Planctomycetota bacterium]
TSVPLSAAEPPRHWLHASALPPGAIGSQRLLRGGPLLGCPQPTEVIAPAGLVLSADSGGGYTRSGSDRMRQTMRIGSLYRFRVEGLPSQPGTPVFPTVELIDRLYPPPGLAERFPLPIHLSADDLRLAAEGALVTRVIYVEDPRTAAPVAQGDELEWFEARGGDDPLVIAGELGRPVAILRIGARDTAGLSRGGFTPVAGAGAARIDAAVRPAAAGR